MEWLTELAQNREAPLLAAFALGLADSNQPMSIGDEYHGHRLYR